MDFVEDGGVIHINAGDRVVGFGVRGLFLDAFDAVAIELGDAETLGVGDFLEKDARAFALRFEGVDGGVDVFLDDVVAEDDADVLAIGEMFAEIESVGNPPFALLIGVGDVLRPKCLPLARRRRKSPEFFPPVTTMMSVIPASTRVWMG